MRFAVPTPDEMMPMLERFHAKAGDCGYTIRQSLMWLGPALQDPFQLVVGVRAPDPCTGQEAWVGYIWVQMFDTFAYFLQAWSDPSVPGAFRSLIEFGEQWARSRGAFTMRGGVSRRWLRALEKRYGYTVKSAIVEKRL